MIRRLLQINLEEEAVIVMTPVALIGEKQGVHGGTVTETEEIEIGHEDRLEGDNATLQEDTVPKLDLLQIPAMMKTFSLGRITV